MKRAHKLSLDIDELTVDTFRTAEEIDAKGTVHGHEPPDTATGDLRYCVCDTRENTCWGGCAPSQPFTCPKPGECQENDTAYMTCATCGWEGGQAVLLPNC